MNNWGRIAVFDLETTGVDTDSSRIVSACIALLDEHGTVIQRWDWLADPGIEIPDGAAAVHGITTERARTLGRDAATVVAEIAQSLRLIFGLGMPLVVYNAPYDLTLLDRELRRHGLTPIDEPGPVIDPLVIDKAVDKYRKGKRTLEVTSALYGVSLDDAHDAGSDAIAAGRVAQAIAVAYPEQLGVPLAELHTAQVAWYAEQARSFAEYIVRVRGDDSFVANTQWPMHEAEFPGSILDTLPIPAPAPRPSQRVPHLDFDTGRLELDGVPLVRALGSGSSRRAIEQPMLAIELGELGELIEPGADLPPTQAIPIVGQHRATPPAPSAYAPSAYAPSAYAPSAYAPSAYDTAPKPGQPAQEVATPSPYVTAPAPAAKRPTVLRVAAGIVTDSTGRTLLVRKRGTTAFMQAGGKIEEGESALDALARELREEIGLELDLDRTEYIGSFRAAAANESDTVIRAEVFAITTTLDHTALDFVAAGEIEQLVWIDDETAGGIELAPLTRDTVLPLWVARRSALF